MSPDPSAEHTLPEPPADDLLPFRETGYRQNPVPYFTAVREQHRAYRSPSGHWVISRYDDVSRLLYDRSLSVEEQDFGPLATMHHGVLASDPPKHTRLRRSVARWFTPKLVARWTEVVREETAARLQAIRRQGGHFDAVFDLAFPVGFGTMSRILGVPYNEAEAHRTRRLNEVVNPALGAAPTGAEMTAAGAAMRELLDQTAALVQAKDRRPGDGLIDALLGLERSAEMSRAETLANVQLLATVGYQDTSHLIAGGLLLLARDPELWETFRRTVPARAGIIDEMLRLDSPEQFVTRLTTRDTAVGDVIIPPGHSVLLFLAAANRDPRVFEDPDAFNWSRDPARSRHLAFSAGLHACVGQVLVRAQAEAVLGAVADAFDRLDLDGPVQSNHTDMFRTLDRVPLSGR